ARGATTTIPIVFEAGFDPVELGLVTSLNRPVTGVSNFYALLVAKQFELLHEMVPNSTAIGVVVNPTSPNLAESTARDAQQAGRLLGKQIHILNASTEDQIDTAFAALVRVRPDALLIGGDSFFTSRRAQLATLATRHGLPTIYNAREFATAGGLMSYGASLVDAYRQTGIYTGKKGAKPAELPVMQPTKFAARDQPHDRQGVWPANSADAPRSRRRGDRMIAPIKRREIITLLGGQHPDAAVFAGNFASMPVLERRLRVSWSKWSPTTAPRA